jgi:soluble lytic murein transglycosylase-like protein
MDVVWGAISRYGIDLAIFGLFIWLLRRNKRVRRLLFKRGRFLKFILVCLFIYFVAPKLFGFISPTVRYLPEVLEAHKLRGYYRAWQYVNPFKSDSRKAINRAILAAGKRYHINTALVKAIVKVESNFNQQVISETGACGLMQLMPSTYFHLTGGSPFGIKNNIFAGTKYFSQQLKAHKGNIQLALAAYNAGPSKVKRYKGIPPFPKTKNYIKQVLYYYNVYKAKS